MHSNLIILQNSTEHILPCSKRGWQKRFWLVTSITHCHPNSHHKKKKKKCGEGEECDKKKSGIIPIMHNCVLYKISRPIIISHYNHWQTKHSVVMLLLLEAVSFPLSLRMADHAWWTVTMWHWWPPVHTHTLTHRERKKEVGDVSLIYFHQPWGLFHTPSQRWQQN